MSKQEILEDVVEIGPWSLLGKQVCAHSEVPPHQIERRANELEPTGIRSRWTLDPKRKPKKCADHPERLHYVLTC